MRYAVYNITTPTLQAAGGQNLVSAVSMSIIFADLTDTQAEALTSEGYIIHQVKIVDTVKPADIAPPVPLPGQAQYSPSDLFDYIGLASLRTITSPPLYGKNLNIAIIDTGIRETHQKVAGHVVYSKNFTTDVMMDGYDHGTAIAGIIAELAPQAGILNMKVMDTSGSATEEEVVLAIDDCINLININSPFAPAVINLSSGTQDLNEPYSVMRVACRQAIAAGIIFVAAAGNSGPATSTILSPACEKYVIAVGSCSTDTREVSYFSSVGPTLEGIIKPDCVLFGENVVVASASSDTAILAKSGTSFSAPLAAVMALLAQEGVIRIAQYSGGVPLGVKPESYSNTLNNGTLLDKWLPKITVKPAGAPAVKDSSYGYGLPFGTLIAQTVQSVTSGSIDMSGLIGGMMMIMMVTMMMRSMTSINPSKGRNAESKPKLKLRLDRAKAFTNT